MAKSSRGKRSGEAAEYPQVGRRGAVRTPSGESVIGLRTPSGTLKSTSFDKREDQDVRTRARRDRRSWETSDEGIERLQDMSDLTGGQMTPGQYHFLRSYGNTSTGPRYWDEQLPGMADPNAAPRPPRWEELTKDQQDTTLAALSQVGGTDITRMIADFGAQYDQGIRRADLAGAHSSHGEKFYSTGEPRQVLSQSASSLGIPENIHAQVNAMTSPNTKFSSNRADSGERYFPNDEAAVHAVKWVQQGNPAASITNELSVTGTGTGRAQGYVNNLRKAALSIEQFLKGTPPSEWITGTKESGPFESSPKTGPYANSWSDSHPQFLVSDVHTGGGGFLPHLSSDKPILLDDKGKAILDSEGKPKRDKSEREKAIASIPFFHSVADFAARQAAAQRNVGSLREIQGAQWGEEQIRRGIVSSQETYKEGGDYVPAKPKREEIEGQGSLF